MPSSTLSTNSRNRGPSSGGKPSMSAMTRIGMCCAYSAAASVTSRPSSLSMSSWQNARVGGSCRLIAVLVNAPSSSLRAWWWNGGSLVNAPSSSLRAWWWNGGSEEIGGEPPIGAMSAGGRP